MARYGNTHRGGAPFGESHARARLTDAQVQEMRREYLPYVRGYQYLAGKFQCGVSTARDICNYFTRPVK